jgi:hypothetical protein
MKQIKCILDMYHKFNMRRINNENHVNFVCSKVFTFYTWIWCIENTFDTQIYKKMWNLSDIHSFINVLIDEV